MPPPISIVLISKQRLRSLLINSLTSSKAFLNGARLWICEPIWIDNPFILTKDLFLNFSKIPTTLFLDTPNLSSIRPVEIFSCVPASTLGLILTKILTVLFSFEAISLIS